MSDPAFVVFVAVNVVVALVFLVRERRWWRRRQREWDRYANRYKRDR